jgi:ribosomal protein L7/L12
MFEAQSQELPAEAMLAIQSGRKLEAIRIVREHTGLSLTEAKELVDRVAAAHSAEAPELPKQAAKEDSGTLRLLLALAVLGGGAAALLML